MYFPVPFSNNAAYFGMGVPPSALSPADQRSQSTSTNNESNRVPTLDLTNSNIRLYRNHFNEDDADGDVQMTHDIRQFSTPFVDNAPVWTLEQQQQQQQQACVTPRYNQNLSVVGAPQHVYSLPSDTMYGTSRAITQRTQRQSPIAINRALRLDGLGRPMRHSPRRTGRRVVGLAPSFHRVVDLLDAPSLERVRPFAPVISEAPDYLVHREKCLATQASKIKHAMYMLGVRHGLGKNPSNEDWEFALYDAIQIDPEEEGFILGPFNDMWESFEKQHPVRLEKRAKTYIQMRQAQINWKLSAYLVRLAAITSPCTLESFRKIDIANRLSYLLSLGWKSGRGNATLLIPFNTWKQEGFRNVVNEYTEFDAKGKWDMFEVAKQCFVSSEESLLELERMHFEQQQQQQQQQQVVEQGGVVEAEMSFGGNEMVQTEAANGHMFYPPMVEYHRPGDGVYCASSTAAVRSQFENGSGHGAMFDEDALLVLGDGMQRVENHHGGGVYF